jgi:hypothetical protein
MDTSSNQFSVLVATVIWISLVVLQPSATLTAPMFSREGTDEGWQRFLSNTEPSLLKWL